MTSASMPTSSPAAMAGHREPADGAVSWSAATGMGDGRDVAAVPSRASAAEARGETHTRASDSQRSACQGIRGDFPTSSVLAITLLPLYAARGRPDLAPATPGARSAPAGTVDQGPLRRDDHAR